MAANQDISGQNDKVPKRKANEPLESDPKKLPVKRLFVYFGISGIIYQELFVPQSLDSLRVAADERICKLIDSDLAIIEDVFGKSVESRSTRKFYRVEETSVFLYLHKEHVTCSSVKKEKFDGIEQVDVKFRLSPQSMENHSCDFCFAFYPFLEDNDNIGKRNLDRIHSLLMEHEGPHCPATSPFVSPTSFFGRGRQYSEDVWSLRLANSLNVFYFIKEFQYTADEGTDFPTKQFKYTQLDASYADVYFFKGSPDIRIRLSSTVSSSIEPVTDLDSSSENESIKGALQATKQKEIHPSKVGEVIAGMYLSIQFKVLKRLFEKGKDLSSRSFSSRAFLISRGWGALFLKMTMQVTDARTIDRLPTVVVRGVDFGNFTLSANRLCFLFQKYLLRGMREAAQGTLNTNEYSEEEFPEDEHSDMLDV